MTMVETPVKTAQPGALMFRRSDVRGKVMKLRQFNHRAMKLALSEGRIEDADLHRGKVRSLVAILNELDELPIFENPAPIEASPPLIRAALDEGAE